VADAIRLWVTSTMGRRFEPVDADGSWTCAELTTAARVRLVTPRDLWLYHYGLDAHVPARGHARVRTFGIRPGDLLFGVSSRWPLIACRGLAEEAQEALLGSHHAEIPDRPARLSELDRSGGTPARVRDDSIRRWRKIEAGR
jgi:hypothetical protein